MVQRRKKLLHERKEKYQFMDATKKKEFRNAQKNTNQWIQKLKEIY